MKNVASGCRATHSHHFAHLLFVYVFSRRGAGGMFDTRDPEARVDEDPRKSIAEAPSFEEYMKQRAAGGN